ncbi:hypothetical protein [Flexivirga oryzae]|uniref:Uncharacterized protein n=1 Tax=Flexivirga oryzae TaxID=1794944 RepID=A0A839N8Z3_9MICO|nr:hypothetical protein [Flexivirga oryzae]MBB2892623.1 hypothetical protein [Flexivirga oryzae]
MADGAASVTLVVAGDASDARLESSFGGRTFGSVAGSTPTRTVSSSYPGCEDRSSKTWRTTHSWVTCTLPVYRGVYVPGLGIAPAGKEWLVVQGANTTREDGYVSVYDAHDKADVDYAPTGPPTVSVTVDGVSAKPRVAGRDRVLGDGVRVATRAWLVPATDSTTVRLRYRLPTTLVPAHSNPAGTPATYLVDVSTTTTYPGAKRRSGRNGSPGHNVHRDVNTHELRWWRRRSVIAVALLLVAAVALSAVLFGRHEADKDRMAVGESRQGDYALSDGSFNQTYHFAVPGATLSVSAAVGHEASMVDRAAGELVTADAPSGGQLVQLHWTLFRATGEDAFTAGSHASRLVVRSQQTSVLVASAGVAPARSYSEGERLVALSGDLSQLQLTLTFEGRTQSISVATGQRQMGAFAPLYRPVQAGRAPAMAQEQPRDPSSPFVWECRAALRGMTRTPYLDGLGWASQGHEWAVVSAAGAQVAGPAARWTDGDHAASYTAVGTPGVSVTVNGERATTSRRTAGLDDDDPDPTRDYVVPIRTGVAAAVRVGVVVSAERDPGADTRAPARTTMRVTTGMDFPAVPDPRSQVSRTGWSPQGGHGTRVGDRIEGLTASSGQLTEQHGYLPVAFGALPITVGTGTTIGDPDAGGGEVRAPDGASLVQVSWDPKLGFGGPAVWPGSSARDRRDPGTDLTLVTGGHRYPLAKAFVMADGAASVTLVVAGDASDARVESRVGGSSFTSTISGEARDGGYPGCEDTLKTSTQSNADVSCTLPVYRGVYVPGLGVAPDGKEWLVVQGASATRVDQDVTVYATHADSKRAVYTPTGPPTVSVTVDGVSAKPRVAGSDTVIGDSVQAATRAWLVPATNSTTVRLRYRLPTEIVPEDSHWPGAPTTHEVDVSTATTDGRG